MKPSLLIVLLVLLIQVAQARNTPLRQTNIETVEVVSNLYEPAVHIRQHADTLYGFSSGGKVMSTDNGTSWTSVSNIPVSTFMRRFSFALKLSVRSLLLNQNN